MAIFKCKICGASLEVSEGESVIACEYCATQQTLPRLDDERRANLYDRANHFRRNNDFDKAMSIYESILNDDITDAEAYWSIVLCKYGVEYVPDAKTKKHVPTVNRTQFTSVFDDEDYKAAILNADPISRKIYEAEAAAINEIQKGILEISRTEDPFDVFICYKETDAKSGARSRDSVLAQELYYELTEEGFRVFFSRITLEDKLGVAYEPYIFAALQSAKVMVVIGTSAENLSSPWVKNEWSRFLGLVKKGEEKVLIPAYKDMDPYELPEEFSHLQAQDMSKLGFMQDLIRGIKKIVVDEEEAVTELASPNAAPLLERAFVFIEDGDFVLGDKYLEKVLDLEPKCAEAYLGKLLIDLRLKKREALASVKTSFAENVNYKRIKRYGSEALVAEIDARLDEAMKRKAERLARLNSLADRELEKREREFKMRSAEEGSDAPFEEDDDYLFEDIFQNDTKSVLTVRRKNQFFIFDLAVKMQIDGQLFFIKNNSALTLRLEKGYYSIIFSCLFRKKIIEIDLKENSEIELSFSRFTGSIKAKVNTLNEKDVFAKKP